MGWRPEVKVAGEDKWHQNALVFVTEEEAKGSALDLFGRWTLCTHHQAVKVGDSPNYKRVDGKDSPLSFEEARERVRQDLNKVAP